MMSTTFGLSVILCASICAITSASTPTERSPSSLLRSDAMSMKRREFLAAGLALPVVSTITLAQGGGGRGRGAAPPRVAKTTKLFKSPGMYPNALAVMTDAPGGLWIGQQKVTASNAKTYNLPVLPDPDEAAWLVDWHGKLIKTVTTPSR